MTQEDVPLKEPILPDDYPIYGGYLYVVDGAVTVSDWHGVTVRELRLRMDAKEIRRCDVAGREEMLRRAFEANGVADRGDDYPDDGASAADNKHQREKECE